MQAKTLKRSHYYLIYSALFVILCLAVFGWYFSEGKTFIWTVDGWDQHYKALVYYGKLLRSVLKNLVREHRLILPAWDFRISEGADILNVLHYYVIGDPLNLLSAFVPASGTHVLYTVLILLRFYLAGAAFSELCFYTGRQDTIAVLSGAFSYLFSFWGIAFAARHPYFLNPMIWFPLVLLGIERVIREKRPVLLASAVCGSAASNFYFFYMIVCLAVLYTAVRLVVLYKKDIKSIGKTVLRLFLASLSGVLVSSAVFLPVFSFFLSDTRLSVGRPWKLLYAADYYRSLPNLFLNTQHPYWLCIGFTAPVILSLIFLWFRKGKRELKALLVLSLVMILSPFFGRVMNGFSYISYRWCWAFSLLSSFVLASVFEELCLMTGKEKLLLFLGLLLFSLLLIFTRKEDDTQLFSGLVILWITCGLLMIPQKAYRTRVLPILLLLSCMVCALRTSYLRNAPEAGNYTDKLVSSDGIFKALYANETKAVKKASDEEPVRYSGSVLTYNAGMIAGLSSTDYNWSLTNPYMDSFREEMLMREGLISKYYGLDTRSALLTLSSVDVYVFPKKNEKTTALPYGFTLSKKASENSDWLVYTNDHALPEGYIYTQAVTEDVWETLSALEKQMIMTEAAMVPGEEDMAGVRLKTLSERETGNDTGSGNAAGSPGKGSLTEGIREVTAVTELSENIEMTGDGTYTASSGKEKITLSFEAPAGCETYVEIHGLSMDLPAGEDTAAITLKASSGVRKTLTFYTEDSDFYTGRTDFLINLGYQEMPVTSLVLTLPSAGTFSFESLKVWSVSYEGFDERIAALKDNALEKIQFETDTVSGQAELEEPGILCVTVPYADGWKAYVDDEEAETFPVNGRYIGVRLPEGKHRIRIVYRRPYQTAGWIVSLVSLSGGILYVILRKKRDTADRLQLSISLIDAPDGEGRNGP